MDPWMEQLGCPIITVTRNYDDNSVTISQETIFDYRSDQSGRLWWIFAEYFYADGDGAILGHLWLPKEERKTFQIDISSHRALLFNMDSHGYYRVNYDLKNWDMIGKVLTTDHNKINVRTRAQILFDAPRLMSTLNFDYDTFLEIFKYLKNETEWLPWVTAFKSLKTIGTPIGMNRSQIEEFWLEWMLPNMKRLGYATRNTDQPQQILLRSLTMHKGSHNYIIPKVF